MVASSELQFTAESRPQVAAVGLEFGDPCGQTILEDGVRAKGEMSAWFIGDVVARTKSGRRMTSENSMEEDLLRQSTSMF